MASWSVRKIVKYKTSVKDPGTPGHLLLNLEKLGFVPNDLKLASKLDMEFRFFRNHKYTKEGSNKSPLLNLTSNQGVCYIFEFENYDDLKVCKELVGKALSKLGKDQKPGVYLEVPVGHPNADELFRRMNLLRENSELQKLHKRFVSNGTLTETEFWATRQKLLVGISSPKSKQSLGLKNVMLSTTKSLTDGQTNKITFNLTPEIVLEIFAEKPLVHRAYLNLVPKKMTDKDFWTKYCRAEYLQQSENVGAALAEAAEDEEVALFLKPDDILTNESKCKIRCIDPTMDIQADQGDDYTHLPDLGFAKDNSIEKTESWRGFHQTLLHVLNRHATVVLNGRVIGEEELKDTQTVAEALDRAKYGNHETNEGDRRSKLLNSRRHSRRIEIEDLQATDDAPSANLLIKDPRDYFDSQRASLLDASTKVESVMQDWISLNIYDSLRSSITETKTMDLMDLVIKPEMAVKVLSVLTHNISSTKYLLGKGPKEGILDMLADTIKDQLLHHWMSIQELLRHFWSSYPITTPYLYSKVTRLKDALSKIDSQLEDMKNCVSSDFRHQVTLLIRPMQQALETAMQHYDAYMEIKDARNGKRLCGHF